VAQTQTQRRASRAVATWLAHREANAAWLVRQTGSDPGTIGDFLNGNRWPKFKTQGRIEKALSWPPGTLTAIADGAEPPDPEAEPDAAVGGDEQDAGYVSAPGPREVGGISDDEVLRVLDKVQEQIDELRRRMETRPHRP